MRSIAIVTGASSGVGREFVLQLDAGKGGPLDEIWAIARSEGLLYELASSCHNVMVRPLAADLFDETSFDNLAGLLEKEQARVEWLVNCAGYGKFGMFSEVCQADNAGMVRLNCLALVDMVSVALPHLHAGSRIINLASIAGIVPQVELATYSATKAFVTELSLMLDHELSSCGIHVTAVCPKFMRTRFLDKPGDADAVQRMTVIGYQGVEEVVSKALRASLRGRALCVPSTDMRLAYVAAKLMPRSVTFALEDLLFGRACHQKASQHR